MDYGNKGLYAFLISCILFSVAMLVLCDLSLMLKAFFISVIVGMLVLMRSLHNALEVPPDTDLEELWHKIVEENMPLTTAKKDQIEDAEFEELSPDNSSVENEEKNSPTVNE